VSGLPTPPLDAEPPAGDEVIAQALRRSILALALIGTVAGGVIWWFARPAPVLHGRVTPLTAPGRSASGVPPPNVRFTDVTAAAGIRFVHANGARGEKLLPETMGGGVVVFDLDGDHDSDLLFLNGTSWSADGPVTTAALYRNDTPPGGTWRFIDITAGSGLEVPLYGMGAAAGDFDADGRVDLFLTCVGTNHLFRNLGAGRFQDVTVVAGVGGSDQWSTAAAWFDLDHDGDLDLFVGNYVGWTPELDRRINTTLVGGGRAYGQPWNFPGTFPFLYRNDTAPGGPPRFTDITAASGLQVRNPASNLPMAKTLAVAPIDLNNDGWMDLVVANDTVQNFVFTNRHNGTFTEVGAQTGIAFDSYGHPRGAMGIDAARFRDDDALGIAIGNFANEMNALYVSQPSQDHLLFADEALTEGIGPASRLLLKFGLFFFDYDLDGRLDVLTANGHIEEEIEKLQSDVRYRQPAQLFWNAGGGPSFQPVTETHSGPDLFQPRVGRGSAFADFDQDGDPDVVICQVNGPPVLLRNDQQLGHHWLRLRLVGRHGNTGAIGAWVRARVAGRTLARQVMPTRSYLSQSELTVTLGLGKSARVEGLQIRWPNGRDQILAVPDSDREIEVVEP